MQRAGGEGGIAGSGVCEGQQSLAEVGDAGGELGDRLGGAHRQTHDLLLGGVDGGLHLGQQLGLAAPLGQLEPQGGTLKHGTNLEIGYFDQQQLEALDLQASAALHLQRLSPEAREQDILNFLGGFNFRGDAATSLIAPFSGGEKARLALAMVVWQRPNLLVLATGTRLPPPSEVEGGIMFRYHAPSARQVTLAGNFNNWGGTQGGGRYDSSIDPMSELFPWRLRPRTFTRPVGEGWTWAAVSRW
mgnify:CR=1 FL=1